MCIPQLVFKWLVEEIDCKEVHSAAPNTFLLCTCTLLCSHAVLTEDANFNGGRKEKGKLPAVVKLIKVQCKLEIEIICLNSKGCTLQPCFKKCNFYFEANCLSFHFSQLHHCLQSSCNSASSM